MQKDTSTRRKSPPSKTGVASGALNFGASMVVNVLSALVRYKAIAFFLGAPGLGLFGLMLNFVSIVSALCGMGLSVSLTGGLGRAHADRGRQLRLVMSALIAVSGVSVIAGILLLSFGPGLVAWQWPDFNLRIIGPWVLVALMVALWKDLLSASLMGIEHGKFAARASMAGVLIAVVLGVALLWRLGEGALAWLIILPNVITITVTCAYLSRLEFPFWRERPRLAEIKETLTELLPAGASMMIYSALSAGGIFISQAMLAGSLGLAAAGGMQAVYAVSLQIVSFLTATLQSTLYPALSAISGDKAEMRRVSNDQGHFVLFLAGGIFLFIAALAELVLAILFDSSFAVGSGFMAIWFAGDILKLLSLVLLWNILAQGRNTVLIGTQLAGSVAMILTVWLVIVFDRSFTLAALGNLALGAAGLIVVQAAMWRGFGLFWSGRIIVQTLYLLAALGVMAVLWIERSSHSMPTGLCLLAVFLAMNVATLKAVIRKLSGR